ncbi:DNA polymerase I [Microcystis phage Mel-JY01]
MNKKYLDIFNSVQEQHQKESTLTRDDNVLIIDGMNLFIRTFSAVPTLNGDGVHVGGITGFLISLCSSIRQFNPTRVIIVFDGKGGSQKRKSIYSGYKGGRAVKSRLNRVVGFEDIVDEQSSMKWQIARLYEYLSCLPITVICIDHIEADDVIAYLTQYFQKNVIVISNDNDFLQLVNNRVSIYVPAKKKLYDQNSVLDEYGVWCENYILYKTVIGDSSDNINGIDGVGKKTALKYFPILKEKRKIEIDEFVEIAKNVSGKNKTADNIKQSIDIINRNYSLMQLETETISGNSQSKIRNIVDSICDSLARFKINRLYSDDKLSTVFPKWGEWLQTNFSRLNILREKI